MVVYHYSQTRTTSCIKHIAPVTYQRTSDRRTAIDALASGPDVMEIPAAVYGLPESANLTASNSDSLEDGVLKTGPRSISYEGTVSFVTGVVFLHRLQKVVILIVSQISREHIEYLKKLECISADRPVLQ